MLSRAFTKPRKSIKDGEQSKSGSISDYEDIIVGFADDLPLISCSDSGDPLTLKEVLRASVGVMGQSPLGMTEKVVLSRGRVCSVKRFRRVAVRKRVFGRRVERLAQICRNCEHLVPITAYLYAKRIKFVLSDYYPMGSLADLLAGGRSGQTALNWNERLKIIRHIAAAIAFIHGQSPSKEMNMTINVHGNIKPSNIMINTDFSACLSEYGFVQLAKCVQQSDLSQENPPSQVNIYCNNLSQKSDMYNFGLLLLDMLTGIPITGSINGIRDRVERKTEGNSNELFEFWVEGKEKKQALLVLNIALACTNRLPEARPSIELIQSNILSGILSKQ